MLMSSLPVVGRIRFAGWGLLQARLYGFVWILHCFVGFGRKGDQWSEQSSGLVSGCDQMGLWVWKLRALGNVEHENEGEEGKEQSLSSGFHGGDWSRENRGDSQCMLWLVLVKKWSECDIYRLLSSGLLNHNLL